MNLLFRIGLGEGYTKGLMFRDTRRGVDEVGEAVHVALLGLQCGFRGGKISQSNYSPH